MEENLGGYGVGDVAMLALRDIEFFELLFADPQAAIRERKGRGQLERVTDEDIQQVETYVGDLVNRPSREQMTEIQERYGKIVQWEPPVWPAMWRPPWEGLRQL